MDIENKMVPEFAPSSSIIVTRRTDRSFITHVFHKLIRPFGPSLIKPKKRTPAGSPKLDIPPNIQKTCDVSERQIESIYLYDIIAKRACDRMSFDKKCRYRVYYFAGGGWQSPPSSHHWKCFAEIATRLPHTTLTVVSYPLAPNSPAPIAFPQLFNLYHAILQESNEAQEIVTFAGDSAGGNVVLALTIEALRQDPEDLKPFSVFAICPSVDLVRHNPKIVEIEKHDPLLRIPFIEGTAKAWYGSGREDAWDCSDPRISPIEADLSVLRNSGVIIDGVSGGYDILGPDAVAFREKLQRAGVKGEWLEWDKMMHCWPLAAVYGLFPESTEAFDWIIEVLKKRSKGR
jgi:acetyl esterase/lipase